MCYTTVAAEVCGQLTILMNFQSVQRVVALYSFIILDQQFQKWELRTHQGNVKIP
jgi:hypothetical protein